MSMVQPCLLQLGALAEFVAATLLCCLQDSAAMMKGACVVVQVEYAKGAVPAP